MGSVLQIMIMSDDNISPVQFNWSVVPNSLQTLGLHCFPLTQGPLSSTNSQSFLRFISTESVILSNHLVLCCPFILLSSIFPIIRVSSSESDLCIRWPKCWSFSFSISLSNEYSGLISCKTNWFDLLAVQGTFKSYLQHHNWKASVLSTQPSLWSNTHIHIWLLKKL